MIYPRQIPPEELLQTQLELVMRNGRGLLLYSQLIGILATLLLFWHYVPTTKDMQRLLAIQMGHTQRVIEIIGTSSAAKLGLRDLSGDHARQMWERKYPDVAPQLGAALSNKCEGLDSLRRDDGQTLTELEANQLVECEEAQPSQA